MPCNKIKKKIKNQTKKKKNFLLGNKTETKILIHVIKCHKSILIQLELLFFLVKEYYVYVYRCIDVYLPFISFYYCKSKTINIYFRI